MAGGAPFARQRATPAIGSGVPVCSVPDPSVLQTSLQDFSSVQHSEQIGPAWNGHSATSGISYSSLQTLHCTCTVERAAGGIAGASRTVGAHAVAAEASRLERAAQASHDGAELERLAQALRRTAAR
jgi:HPt (histidine-containing phosphotransfer) domain-containing protein